MNQMVSDLVWLYQTVGAQGIGLILMGCVVAGFGIAYNKPIRNYEKRELMNLLEEELKRKKKEN